MWLEEKFGFAVKQSMVMGSEPEKLMFEMRQLSYAPSAATLFTAPANCTVVAGVVNATGGHAEMNVDVSAQAEVRLKGGPPAKKAFNTAGPDPLAGKWQVLGKDGSGAAWDGTLAIDKPGADDFNDGTYTNICDLNMQSANSGKGMSGPCVYDAKTKTLTFAGGADSSKFTFTAVLSPDGKSLTQGRWVEAKGNGAWSAKR